MDLIYIVALLIVLVILIEYIQNNRLKEHKEEINSLKERIQKLEEK